MGIKGTSKGDPKFDFKMDSSSVFKGDKKRAKLAKDGGAKKMGKKGKVRKGIDGIEPVSDVQPVILDTDYGSFIDDGMYLAVGILSVWDEHSSVSIVDVASDIPAFPVW